MHTFSHRVSAVGIASIIAFRDRVCEILHVVEDDEEDVSIQKVGKQIFQETKKFAPDNRVLPRIYSMGRGI